MGIPSSILNPYASHLGDRDPLLVMQTTPWALKRLIDELGADGLERSLRPGSWSASRIIAHLADTEIAFAFRIRQCLAEDHHVIQPFDQDRWNALLPETHTARAFQTFAALRDGNLALVKDVSASVLVKPVTHPERGEMTFRDVLATIGGHDINHLEQLETLVRRR